MYGFFKRQNISKKGGDAVTPQEQNLILLVRSVMHGSACRSLQSPDYAQITKLAYEHKLLGMLLPSVQYIPDALRPEPAVTEQWRRYAKAEAVKDANQQYEFERVLAALEQAGIPSVPLKGFAIKQAYPQTYLRSMSDIDILYDARYAEQLRQCMLSLGCHVECFDTCDTDTFISQTGLSFEMHRNLEPDAPNAAAQAYLSALLSDAAPRDGFCHVRALSHEDQYVYTILHILKHFHFAGTGIRSVLDVWALRQRGNLDENSLSHRWQAFGIDTFVRALEQLSDCWFGSGQADDLLEQMGDYIVSSGAYGSEENKVHAGMLQAHSGRRLGKVQYALRRFFLPYRAMCHEYPILRRVPVLLPFLWLYRPFDALLHRGKKLRGELSMVRRYDPADADAVRSLHEALGIL